MKRSLLSATLLALAISPLLHVARVDAQGRYAQGERPSRDRQAAAPDENPFPNATRAEPERETSERNMRKIQAAYTALEEGDYEKVRSNLEPLDGSPRLSPYEQALVDQGLAQVAYEEDDVDGAIARWTKAIDGNALPNRDHFQLIYQIAQLQLSEERYDQALAMVDRWLAETRTTRADAMALKGNALFRMERYDEALVVLDQAIAAGGDTVDPTLVELKMAALYEKEDYAAAAVALEDLMRRQPNEIKHQINLAQMYIELEQNDRALAILQRARTGGNLKSKENWRQLYQLFAYADKPLDAAAAINEGIAAGALEADRETLKALGDHYYMGEQVDSAIEAYGRAAALSTDDGNADQMRAHLLVERERYAEAKQALDAAFAKGKLTDEGTAWLLLGESEQELGNTEAARAAFQKAVGFERSRANAQAWLSNLNQ